MNKTRLFFLLLIIALAVYYYKTSIQEVKSNKETVLVSNSVYSESIDIISKRIKSTRSISSYLLLHNFTIEEDLDLDKSRL